MSIGYVKATIFIHRVYLNTTRNNSFRNESGFGLLQSFGCNRSICVVSQMARFMHSSPFSPFLKAHFILMEAVPLLILQT